MRERRCSKAVFIEVRMKISSKTSIVGRCFSKNSTSISLNDPFSFLNDGINAKEGEQLIIVAEVEKI